MNKKTIAIVSYFDDNFGDMLIKISFECLLKTVLDNLGISEQYSTEHVSLRDIDEAVVRESSLICFAGGGMLGNSYLQFAPYVTRIVQLAEECDIPVIFSSVGINDMAADEDGNLAQSKLLSSRAIKAISVRENCEWFNNHMKDTDLTAVQVCDPATWSDYIFSDITAAVNKSKPLVGINCVRNDLFLDNGYSWTYRDQYAYVDEIIKICESKDYDYLLYTNGSMNDNSFISSYVKLRNIDESHYVYVKTSEQLIQTIRHLDFCYALRLHSAILAYAMKKPVCNIVWNAKIPLFYEAIGCADAVVYPQDWTPEISADFLTELSERGSSFSHDYLMTLYNWLYEQIGIILPEAEQQASEPYAFDEICSRLPGFYRERRDEYLLEDLWFKTDKGERTAYRQTAEILELLSKLSEAKKNNKELKKELKACQKKLASTEKKLQAMYSKLPIKIYRKIKNGLH